MRKSLILAMVVAVLTGCTLGPSPMVEDRVDLGPADLVGTWQNGAQEGMLGLAEDGRFVAAALPYQVFQNFPGVLPDGFDPQRDRLDGSGQWSLEASREDRDGPRNHVTLHVRMLAGRAVAGSVELRAERQDSSVVLAFYLGDPDLRNRYVYHKCPTACPTITPS